MKLLIAEDDVPARVILRRALHQLGHEVIETENGEAAWRRFEHEPVRIVVSDWMMPHVDGLELCRRIRARVGGQYTYFILLTSLDASSENKRMAADSGVDDFLTKPLNPDDLWTRLRTAERILNYAVQVHQLERLLPLCSFCRKIRDDKNYWQEIESYLRTQTGSQFSHSICPECYKSIVIPQMKADGIAFPPPGQA